MAGKAFSSYWPILLIRQRVNKRPTFFVTLRRGQIWEWLASVPKVWVPLESSPFWFPHSCASTSLWTSRYDCFSTGIGGIRRHPIFLVQWGFSPYLRSSAYSLSLPHPLNLEFHLKFTPCLCFVSPIIDFLGQIMVIFILWTCCEIGDSRGWCDCRS